MSGGNTPEEHALPCWYYEKSDLKKTPSFYDGIPYETETRYRREGPKFIFQMGTKLGLHYATIATAVVYFHRFYMFHSFKKVQRHVATTCCLFIAGKVEETPKKCRDLIKTARSLLSDAQFSHFGDDPREEVMTMEKMLLHSIRFDFFVEHPYNYILEYAKALKGDRQKIEKLVQMAWTFVNDSLSTSLCLLWEPQIIAVAVMYLAGRLCKFEPQDWAYNRGRWWEQFIDDITPDLLEEICHQVLDQYSNSGKEAKKGENKAKRERPKTPKDSSSSEPQAKVSRTDSIKSTPKAKHPATHDHHHHATPGSSKKSASRIHTIVTNQTPSKPIQRRLSSSTNNDLSVLNEEDSSNDVPAKQIETIKPPLPTIPEPLISSKTAVPLQLLSHPGTPENGKVSYLPQPHNQYQSYHNSASTDMFYISHNNAAVAAASPASNVYKNVAVSQPSTSNYPMQSFPTTFPNVSPMAHNPLQSLSHRPPPPPSGFPPPPPNPYTDFRRLPPPRLNTSISNPATTAQQMIYSASGAPQYNQQQQQHQQQHHQNPMPNHAVGLPRIRITGRRDQQNAHQWM